MINFATLWTNHPTVKREELPCSVDGRPKFENQCAIKLATCLDRSGIDTSSFNGARCWYHQNPRHILRAQELANWLASSSLKWGVAVQKIKGRHALDAIRGKTGILFLQDYWGERRQGDHIDLWNGHRLTALDSWFRINARIGQFGLHSLGFGSDMKQAKETWFWPLP